MNLIHQVPATLHREHFDTLALLQKLDAFMAKNKVSSVPPLDGPARELLGLLIAALDGEVTHHFRFEEEHLFPLLAESGETELGELLTEEHTTILPAGQRLAELARAARLEGFTGDAWREFFGLSAEFSERLVSHVQKEEMALVPLLDSLLDAETDGRLESAYLLVRTEA